MVCDGFSSFGASLRRTRAGRVIQLALALALISAMSGAPQLVAMALGVDECCETECEGSLGTQHCPPTCTEGSCAKAFATILDAPAAEVVEVASFVSPTMVTKPIGFAALSGVFHPPKA